MQYGSAHGIDENTPPAKPTRAQEAQRMEDKRLKIQKGISSMEACVDVFLQDASKDSTEDRDAQRCQRELPIGNATLNLRERRHLYKELSQWLEGHDTGDAPTDKREARMQQTEAVTERSLQHLQDFQGTLHGLIDHCHEAVKLAADVSKGKAVAESQLSLLRAKLRTLQEMADSSPVKELRAALLSRDEAIVVLRNKERLRAREVARLQMTLDMHSTDERGHEALLQSAEETSTILRHELSCLKKQLRLREPPPATTTATNTDEGEAAASLSCGPVALMTTSSSLSTALTLPTSNDTACQVEEEDCLAIALDEMLEELPLQVPVKRRHSEGRQAQTMKKNIQQLKGLAFSRNFYEGVSLLHRVRYQVVSERCAVRARQLFTQSISHHIQMRRAKAKYRADTATLERYLADANSTLLSVKDLIAADDEGGVRAENEKLSAELDAERARRITVQRELLEHSEHSIPLSAFNEICSRVAECCMNVAICLQRERREAEGNGNRSTVTMIHSTLTSLARILGAKFGECTVIIKGIAARVSSDVAGLAVREMVDYLSKVEEVALWNPILPPPSTSPECSERASSAVPSLSSDYKPFTIFITSHTQTDPAPDTASSTTQCTPPPSPHSRRPSPALRTSHSLSHSQPPSLPPQPPSRRSSLEGHTCHGRTEEIDSLIDSTTDEEEDVWRVQKRNGIAASVAKDVGVNTERGFGPLPTMRRAGREVARALLGIKTTKATILSQSLEWHTMRKVKTMLAEELRLASATVFCIFRRIRSRIRLKIDTSLREHIWWCIFDTTCEQLCYLQQRHSLLREVLQRGGDEQIDARFVVLPNNTNLHKKGHTQQPLVINPNAKARPPNAVAMKEFMEVRSLESWGKGGGGGSQLYGYTAWDKAKMLRDGRQRLHAAGGGVGGEGLQRQPRPPEKKERPGSAGGGGGGGGRSVKFSDTVVTDTPQKGARLWRIPALCEL